MAPLSGCKLTLIEFCSFGCVSHGLVDEDNGPILLPNFSKLPSTQWMIALLILSSPTLRACSSEFGRLKETCRRGGLSHGEATEAHPSWSGSSLLVFSDEAGAVCGPLATAEATDVTGASPFYCSR